MSLANGTLRHEYAGDGVTTTFPYQFKIFASSDLQVWILKDGVESLKSLGFYSVTGVGSESGGNVIFLTAPAIGERIVILSAAGYTQPQVLTPNSNFLESAVETALDRNARLAQQNNEHNIRSLALPVTTNIRNPYVPDLPGNQNKFLRVNASATGFDYVLPGSGDVFAVSNREYRVATAGQTVFPTTNAYHPGLGDLHVYVNGVRQVVGQSYVETTGNSITFTSGLEAGDEVEYVFALYNAITSIGAGAVSYAPGGSGAVSTTVQSKLRETISLADFGAVTGTDITIKLNAAITYLSTLGGGTIFIGSGLFFVSSTITLASNVHIVGAGKGATIIRFIPAIPATTQMITGSSVTRTAMRYLTLDGNRASNSAISGLSGVRWINTTWSVLDNVRMTGFTQHGVDASTGNNDNLVIGCDFDDYGTGAIGFGVVFLNNCHRNRILGCRASNLLSGVGFAIDDRSGGTGPNASNHNIIANCTTDGGDFGIQVQGSSFNIVEGNTIYRPKNYGIQCSSGSDAAGASDAQHNIIRGNVIEIQPGVNANGIQLTGLYHICEGNVVRDGLEGIIVNDVTNALSDTEYITIRGNSLVSNSARGIVVAGGRRVNIEGNMIVEAGSFGVDIEPTIADAAVNDVIIANNMISKAGAAGVRVISTATIAIGRVQIIGNHINDPSQLSSGTHPGILITKNAATTCNGIQISENRVVQLGATAPKQVIELTGSPTEVDIFNNRNWGFTDNSFQQGVMSYFQTAGGLEFQEMSSGSSAPAANRAILYAVDNGSGKTRLEVRFGSGAAQVIATEP